MIKDIASEFTNLKRLHNDWINYQLDLYSEINLLI